jgi:transglutaminase-like putative cysteine protease
MSLFRHGRATPAVGSAGILLFLDVLVPSAYRTIDPVLLAIAFAALALFLLVRLHLAQQQVAWARRSVTEGADVARVFLGAGSVFVAAVLVGTTALTTFAVAERGTIPWQSLAQPLESVRQQLLRLLEGLGVSIPPERPPESLFSDRQEIPDRWQLGEGTAFRAFVDGEQDHPYWFGAAYDTFTREGYRYSGEVRTGIAGGELRHGNLEIPSRGTELRESFTTTIAPERDGHYTLLGPATTIEVTTPLRGIVFRRDPGGARIKVDLDPRSSADSAYDVISSEVSFGPADGSVSAEDLRASGEGQLPGGLEAYLSVDDDLIGPATAGFVRQIERQSEGRGDNPYDKALLVQDTMRKWEYDTDMTGVCGDRPAAECLIEEQRGFCSYYATAMAIVLREMGIPTRLVHGYLPGLDDGPNRWIVPLQAAHAWVEVWFEDVGWIRFDPTPELESFGGIGTSVPEQESGGPSVPEPSLGPIEPSPSPEAVEPSPSPSVDDAGAAAGAGGGPDLPMLAILAVAGLAGAALVAGGIALFFIRRLPGGDATRAYPGIVGLARRLGHGPTPSQTELEYVQALGEALPSVGQELELVGKVHVEAVYGRRGAAADVGATVRDAYARARTALLRLLVRR